MEGLFYGLRVDGDTTGFGSLYFMSDQGFGGTYGRDSSFDLCHCGFCGWNDFRGTKQEQTLSDGRILWFFVFSLYLWHQRYMESQFIWYVSHDFDNTSGLCHGRNAGGNALSAQKREKLTKRKS